AFLLSADTGVYSLASLSITVSCAFIEAKDNALRSRILKFAGLTYALAVGWALVLNRAFGSWWNFNFWRTTVTVVTDYRWSMAVPMTAETFARFLIVTGSCFVLFTVAWIWHRRDSPSLARRPLFVSSAAIFSLLSLQSCIV